MKCLGGTTPNKPLLKYCVLYVRGLRFVRGSIYVVPLVRTALLQFFHLPSRFSTTYILHSPPINESLWWIIRLQVLFFFRTQGPWVLLDTMGSFARSRFWPIYHLLDTKSLYYVYRVAWYLSSNCCSCHILKWHSKSYNINWRPYRTAMFSRLGCGIWTCRARWDCSCRVEWKQFLIFCSTFPRIELFVTCTLTTSRSLLLSHAVAPLPRHWLALLCHATSHRNGTPDAPGWALLDIWMICYHIFLTPPLLFGLAMTVSHTSTWSFYLTLLLHMKFLLMPNSTKNILWRHYFAQFAVSPSKIPQLFSLRFVS